MFTSTASVCHFDYPFDHLLIMMIESIVEVGPSHIQIVKGMLNTLTTTSQYVTPNNSFVHIQYSMTLKHNTPLQHSPSTITT